MIDVLSLLDGVRESGLGQYLSRCPAHDDKSPSLSIRHTGDGKWLLHCFAGCDIEAIVSALGLTFADLMSGDRDANYSANRRTARRRASRLSSRDALVAMDHNALVVAVIGADMLEHREIDDETWELLANSVERIGAARDACCPERYRP